eukprot:gb/GEZN01001843.1/.p1 GENE.gb/GEZN01001843.1/~~gb/GEZN01001843.1/.p1  ORF type:complete len:679 (-),score=164.44 gb/GEZN01001843.1/:170-2206(-)
MVGLDRPEHIAQSPFYVPRLPPLECPSCAKLKKEQEEMKSERDKLEKEVGETSRELVCLREALDARTDSHRSELETAEKERQQLMEELAQKAESEQEERERRKRVEEERDNALREMEELKKTLTEMREREAGAEGAIARMAKLSAEREQLEQDRADLELEKAELESARVAAKSHAETSFQELQTAKLSARQELEAAKSSAQQEVEAARMSAQQEVEAARMSAQQEVEAARLSAQAELEEARAAKEAAEAADAKAEMDRREFEVTRAGVEAELEAAKEALDVTRAGVQAELEAAREALQAEKDRTAQDLEQQRLDLHKQHQQAEEQREALRKAREEMQLQKIQMDAMKDAISKKQSLMEAIEGSAEMEKASIEADQEQLRKDREAVMEAKAFAERLQKQLEEERKRLAGELEMSDARVNAARKEMDETTNQYKKEVAQLKEIINVSQNEVEALQGIRTGWTRTKLIQAAKEELHEAKPWFGIMMMEEEFEPAHQRGVQVRGVLPGGPAEAAGIRVGDAIEMGNGELTPTNPKFKKMLRRVQAGDEITCHVNRGRQILPLRVKVGTKTADHKTIQMLRRVAAGVIVPADTQFMLSYREKTGKSMEASSVSKVTTLSAPPPVTHPTSANSSTPRNTSTPVVSPTQRKSSGATVPPANPTERAATISPTKRKPKVPRSRSHK